jgi:enolase
VTNVDFLRKGIEKGVANSILVKVNQIGRSPRRSTAWSLRRKPLYGGDLAPLRRDRRHDDRGYRRGDECGTDQDGFALPTDRVAKYNQLLRIEEELGDNAVYGGKMRF